MREIIGHGAVAKSLEGVDKPFLFFASGVADSHEEDEAQYDRERQLLLSQDRSKHIVYFSSLVIFFDPKRRYSQHKIEMEEIVKTFEHYTIIRLGNPTWATNPHQLIPFFKDKLKNGGSFDIYDEYRHLITMEDFLYWINLIPEDRNCEIMITGQLVKVWDIVEEIKEGKI